MTGRGDKGRAPKRYYRPAKRLPEGIDRLEAEVLAAVGAGTTTGRDGAKVTAERIERWIDELFPGGGMKATVGYIILRYGAWAAAMDVAAMPDSKTGFRAAWALEWAYEQAALGDGRVATGDGAGDATGDAAGNAAGEGRVATGRGSGGGQAAPNGLPKWFFDRLVDDFCTSGNGSLHRIYAKMVCDMMRFGGTQPTDNQIEKLAEKCFDLAIDPATKSAAKFWALEVLSHLVALARNDTHPRHGANPRHTTTPAPRIDWIAGELEALVRHISQQPDCSPGLRVATREILARLK